MKFRFTTVCIASAAAFAAIPGPALAALLSSGGGDFDVVPLFRALAFGTVNLGGNGGVVI